MEPSTLIRGVNGLAVEVSSLKEGGFFLTRALTVEMLPVLEIAF